MSQDTKDLLKLIGMVVVFVVVLSGVLTIHSHVKAADHAVCIQAASEEGIDGPSIVLLCGKV